MNLEASVNKKTRSISLEKLGSGNLNVRLDSGEVRSINVKRVEVDAWSVLLDGRSYEITVQVVNDTYRVSLMGTTWHIDVYDPRRNHRKGTAAGPVNGHQVISSPMPGRVVRIEVKEGDKVETGQAVIVVEAMKMENELSSEGSGTVKEIKVKAGDTVEDGQALVIIE